MISLIGSFYPILGVTEWITAALVCFDFSGVYISKTSYVKQGERSLDCYYRPFHVVEYYRYMRFFSDGTVVLHTSADEPTIAIQRLKVKLAGSNSSVSVGHYRLNGDKVCFSLLVKG